MALLFLSLALELASTTILPVSAVAETAKFRLNILEEPPVIVSGCKVNPNVEYPVAEEPSRR